MAHFAQLDSDNVVTQVLVVNNDDILVNGEESEQAGIDYLRSLIGSDTNWVQTSYNSAFRGHFATQGDTFDSAKDIFISEQPYTSWTLNETTGFYEPPTPMPDTLEEGSIGWEWDEDSLSWSAIYP